MHIVCSNFRGNRMLGYSHHFIMAVKKIYTCVSYTTAINLGPESSRFYKAREGGIELISEGRKCISIVSSGRHGYMVSKLPFRCSQCDI